MTSPCPCAECVLAGCDRPPITLAKTKLFPQRELHGRELANYWRDVDERRKWLTKLVEDYTSHDRRSL